MKQAHTRIQAAIGGRVREVGPVEAHARTVLAVTRTIHALERRQRALRRRLEDTRVELRHKRRELRVLLQRDASIGEEAPALNVAGRADAIDAAEARRERE